MSSKRVYLDRIRTLGFAAISGVYAPIPYGDATGEAVTVNPRIIIITNATQGAMMFSDDGSTDKLFVAAGSFKLLDLTSNIVPKKDDSFVIAKGTIMYVKQIGAPVSGAVYVEYVYG